MRHVCSKAAIPLTAELCHGRFAPMSVIQSWDRLSRKRSSVTSRGHGFIQHF
jgi:hypothetical protein